MSAKILLVDDEPKVLSSLRRTLGERFQLTCAASGAEALELVERDGPFAAVVSDMRMPGMSGLELLREMRWRAPETVRMVLSGIADFDVAVGAINEGAIFRFHTKPVAPEILAASLDCALLQHLELKQAGKRIDPNEAMVRESAEVRTALAENQFRLYLQPQWRVTDGLVVGAEALVRWEHPQRGLLGPGQFLSQVEMAGKMAELTVWMLEAACVELQRWSDLGLTSLHIAVNATALDFCSNGFAERVQLTLKRHGVAPQALELELTEFAAVADTGGTRATMHDLARYGTATSIDDFGSGYSSLGWLRLLPVTKIKLDRLFIEDVTTDPSAYRLLGGIVEMARDLNLIVLAEGIETEEQMEKIREAGCDQGQGFLVARPMPAADFIPWLATRPQVARGA